MTGARLAGGLGRLAAAGDLSLLLVVLASIGCASANERAEVHAPSRFAQLPAWLEPGITASSTTALVTPKLMVPRSLGEPTNARRFHGKKITLDLVNADVREVCRLVAEVAHVNVVVADDVKGAVTMRLVQVPWDQALDVILRVKGFVSERDDNIILVFAPR